MGRRYRRNEARRQGKADDLPDLQQIEHTMVSGNHAPTNLGQPEHETPRSSGDHGGSGFTRSSNYGQMEADRAVLIL
jgi:hypothetical protein